MNSFIGKAGFTAECPKDFVDYFGLLLVEFIILRENG
jgi:hypothetical protein